MIDWPIGLSTSCFYKKNIFEVLPKIREYGFRRLEINSSSPHMDCSNHKEVQEIRNYIENNGLEAYSMHAMFNGDIDISSPDEKKRKYSLETILQAAVAGRILNIRYFVVHPGPSISFKSLAFEEVMLRRKNMINSMQEISRLCSANNIRLTIENIMAHLLFGDMGDLFKIFSSLRDEYPAICLDTGHAFLARNLIEMIHMVSQQLRLIHAADNYGSHDDHLAPGKGHIKWPHVIYALHKVNFKGTFIIELDAAEKNDDYKILEAASQGRRFLRELERTLYFYLDRPVESLMNIDSLVLPGHIRGK